MSASTRVPEVGAAAAPIIPLEDICHPRFAAVRNAFAQNFAERGEAGAAVAVWHDGALAVDLWGGHADSARTRAWKPNTLVCCMSVSKAVTALACAALLERAGGLDLAAPVARYWPEFAAEGKAAVEVGWCLDHRASLPWLVDESPAEGYTDWERVTHGPAAQAPVTPPRSRTIGRTEHRSGITAALHWHRTPATGALIFLFLATQPAIRTSASPCP